MQHTVVGTCCKDLNPNPNSDGSAKPSACGYNCGCLAPSTFEKPTASATVLIDPASPQGSGLSGAPPTWVAPQLPQIGTPRRVVLQCHCDGHLFSLQYRVLQWHAPPPPCGPTRHRPAGRLPLENDSQPAHLIANCVAACIVCRFQQWVSRAQPFQGNLQQLQQYCSVNITVNITDFPEQTKDLVYDYSLDPQGHGFTETAQHLPPMMPDLREGAPRGSYQGYVIVRCRGRRLFLRPTAAGLPQPLRLQQQQEAAAPGANSQQV